MGKVFKFPGVETIDVQQPDQVASQLKASMPSRFTAGAVALFVVKTLRVALFLVMYWLRMPIVGICNLISVPLLLAFLFVWFAFPDKTNMLIGFGVLSFTTFVMAWLYDFILMMLSPQSMVKTF